MMSCRLGRHRIATLFLTIAACCVSTRIAAAQQLLAFDVVLIKLCDPTDSPDPFVAYPGKLSAVNASLKLLTRFAYEIPEAQIIGGPGWISTARYDIEARVDSATPVPSGAEGTRQLRLLTQALLAERFKLAVR